MPSSKKYDEVLSDKSGEEISCDNSEYASDGEFIPIQRYEKNWYDYNQEHILNIWEIICNYINTNGLNLMEKATIISFTDFCAKTSYRKEFDNRVHSIKSVYN